MRTPKGRELAERLIAASSVVSENFAPGVMERWGLTYERLRELSPNVIYARMSGYGHSGPHAEYRSYGPVVQAVSGLSYISGLPGREPSGWGLSYMDNQAAYYNSAALLMAIYRRDAHRAGHRDRRLGDRGRHQPGRSGAARRHASTGARRAGPTSRPATASSGRHAAPHGVYPARGEDRWVAIAVFDDAQWAGLVAALGIPAWAADARFATQEDRFRNQDALDEHVSAWTRDRDRHEVMELLQRHGVPAGAVQNAEDLNEHDPQIAHRGVFFEMDHPVIGPARFEGNPIQFSSTGPGQLAIGAAARRGQRVRVQADRRRRRRRVRRAARRGRHLMSARSSTAPARSSSSPAIRPAR